jgi:hypothetical protein
MVTVVKLPDMRLIQRRPVAVADSWLVLRSAAACRIEGQLTHRPKVHSQQHYTNHEVQHKLVLVDSLT